MLCSADLAAARRRAEGSLANVERERLVSHIREAAKFATRSERMVFLHDYEAKALVAVIDALRSLLAATPEPTPALPDEVREAAEAFRKVNSAQRDDSCTDAGCIVCKRREAGERLLAALAARKRGTP